MYRYIFPVISKKDVNLACNNAKVKRAELEINGKLVSVIDVECDKNSITELQFFKEKKPIPNYLLVNAKVHLYCENQDEVPSLLINEV